MGREGYIAAKRFIDFFFNGIYKIFSGCREVAAKVRGVREPEPYGGKGIAYTIPMQSVIGVSIYQFLSNNKTSK